VGVHEQEELNFSCIEVIMVFFGKEKNKGDSGIVEESYFGASRWSKTCPYCLRWFALVFVEVRSDPIAESLRVFRCKHCDKETAIPDQLPPHVLG
jgi:hypothetical protein